jgi:hypothetical protein
MKKIMLLFQTGPLPSNHCPAFGFLVALILIRPGESGVRSPNDPGDAPAMLGVCFMLAGAVIGTFIGIVVAIALYLKGRWRAKLR